MGMTELEEVQALLEHVLPDPSGFAQRLLLQAMTRWGQSAMPRAGAFSPDANAFYTAAPAEDDMVSATVTAADSPVVDESAIDTNLLLAAAVGACECWGLRANCHLCWGQGSAGWTEPDPPLFEEFVQPAVARMSRVCADRHERPSDLSADQDSYNHRTAEGERE